MLMRGQTAQKTYHCDECGNLIEKGDLYLVDDIPYLKTEMLSKYHALCYKKQQPECFNDVDIFFMSVRVEKKFKHLGMEHHTLANRTPQPRS